MNPNKSLRGNFLLFLLMVGVVLGVSAFLFVPTADAQSCTKQQCSNVWVTSGYWGSTWVNTGHWEYIWSGYWSWSWNTWSWSWIDTGSHWQWISSGYWQSTW